MTVKRPHGQTVVWPSVLHDSAWIRPRTRATPPWGDMFTVLPAKGWQTRTLRAQKRDPLLPPDKCSSTACTHHGTNALLQVNNSTPHAQTTVRSFRSDTQRPNFEWQEGQAKRVPQGEDGVRSISTVQQVAPDPVSHAEARGTHNVISSSAWDAQWTRTNTPTP